MVTREQARLLSARTPRHCAVKHTRQHAWQSPDVRAVTLVQAQIFVNAYAKALEVIPRQLCANAGFDANEVINKLRQKHQAGHNQCAASHSICALVCSDMRCGVRACMLASP